MQRGILGGVCVVVVGVYAYMAQSGELELVCPSAADTQYNLLVRGFRAGQLSLEKEVPPGFAQLADPYDPGASGRYLTPPYRMLDLSYYKGRLYLYFGVTPALILFWPYVVLTGQYLFHEQAVAIFCIVGYLASVGLLRAVWRRYFAEVSVGVVAACALALGLATGVPLLLSKSDVYEVSISCGYMLTMLALGAIWCALHEPERRWLWLAAASVTYGLAVGARPNLLFGAVILLVPVAQAWRERRRGGSLLTAAVVPIAVIGFALMLYNALRFDNPLEFGGHYQLAGQRLVTRQFFSPRYLWFNFRVFFLEPAHWSTHSPFVLGSAVPPTPTGYGQVRRSFGVLTNIPLTWLALAVPLALRGRTVEARPILRAFLAAAAVLAGICALTICHFSSASIRYEVEFLPALVLLAVIGILELERVLAPTPESGLARRPVRRRAVRWGWGLLLGFSVAFNLLASVADYAEAHNNLGFVLQDSGKIEEAIGHYKQALRLNPDYPEAHKNLGNALLNAGNVGEAILQFEQALRIRPDYAQAHNDLGGALWKSGNVQDAIVHFEQAQRLKPDSADVHYNLGSVLLQQGKVPEAVEQLEQALRINPDDAEAHNNLGNALERAGRLPEAISHWEQALRIQPDFAEAQNSLARARAVR